MRVFLTLVQEEGEAFDCTPAGFAIVGRAPFQKVALHRVQGDNKGTPGTTNLGHGLPAGVSILLVPPAGPDPANQAVGSSSRLHEGILVGGTELQGAIDYLETARGADPR